MRKKSRKLSETTCMSECKSTLKPISPIYTVILSDPHINAVFLEILKTWNILEAYQSQNQVKGNIPRISTSLDLGNVIERLKKKKNNIKLLYHHSLPPPLILFDLLIM